MGGARLVFCDCIFPVRRHCTDGNLDDFDCPLGHDAPVFDGNHQGATSIRFGRGCRTDHNDHDGAFIADSTFFRPVLLSCMWDFRPIGSFVSAHGFRVD